MLRNNKRRKRRRTPPPSSRFREGRKPIDRTDESLILFQIYLATEFVLEKSNDHKAKLTDMRDRILKISGSPFGLVTPKHIYGLFKNFYDISKMINIEVSDYENDEEE